MIRLVNGVLKILPFPLPIHFFLLSLQCSHTEAPHECGADEGGNLYIGKALSDALFLTTRNLAVPNN